MIPNMPTGGDPTQPVKLDPSSFDPRNPMQPVAVTDQTYLDATFHNFTRTLINGRIVKNATDAYWYSQPPEVQQLYFLHSEYERYNLAYKLAGEGYKIDVPIMVWGYDPLATMVLRQNQGLSWVPSANMVPFSGVPGVPDSAPYKPGDPMPSMGIPVTTDWAAGLEKTDVWLYDQVTGERKL